MDQQEAFQDKQEPKPESTQIRRSIHDKYQYNSVYGVHNAIFSNIENTNAVIETIKGHRMEFEDIGVKLAKYAHKYKTISLITKVLTIFFGAFIVTKEVANQILGSSNIGNIIIYAAIGLLIATLTGLDTAFKWEKKSIELGALVAVCRATTRKTASDLAKISEIATSQENDSRNKANKILDTLDNALVDVQTKAAALGIDTTRYKISTRESDYKL
ncbi:hypothetical protein [Dictyobacter aurantiacus]|uniref:SMODS and SLOG-associating 2TM effector domain-containing protein n=1 Tax=Dictyobacter aurantiacus TaxID=1936993 RepID=A0A401ZAT0_9CHLR|nr:hypothetical protein [Dictyobacter aurantiacus]GCE03965.1 hypothetical protein KDAU_12940 [Dictyobacter aurantiacus]